MVWNVEAAECLSVDRINCRKIIVVNVFNFGTLVRVTSRHCLIHRNWKSIWFSWRNIHAARCRNSNSARNSFITFRERCNLAKRNNCTWFNIQGCRKIGPGERRATGASKGCLLCLGNFSCRWYLQIWNLVKLPNLWPNTLFSLYN